MEKTNSKKIIEAISGYLVALFLVYLFSIIFGFKNYVKMFFYVSFVYGIMVYLTFSYSKKS